jgi:hypothetical protein
MPSKIDRSTRRKLLAALGVGPALLPLLSLEEEAAGQTPAARRALFLVWADGMLSKTSTSRWPGEGTSYTLSPMMTSLEPHRADLLLIDNINYRWVRESDNPSGGEVSGHACFQGMLTGAKYRSFGSSTASNVAGGPSIDQHIGNSLRTMGYAGLTSLNLGVFVKSTARLSWRAAADPIVPTTDPYRVFTQIFGNSTGGGGTGGSGSMPDPNVDRARRMKVSILDTVIKDLDRFKGRVGTEDRARIDSHLQSIREIEQGLMGTSMPPTTGSTTPMLPQGVNTGSTQYFHTTTKMMIDLSVAALAADATRVVVLQLGDQGDSDLILYNLGFMPGGEDGNTGNVNGFHSCAHRNGTEKDQYDTWFHEQVAYTVATMKTQGILESSSVIAMNNMRTGQHEYNNVPAMIGGSLGGYFGLGRSIKLPANTTQNPILVGVANAMGVPTQTFGEASYGGELAVLRG